MWLNDVAQACVSDPSHQIASRVMITDRWYSFCNLFSLSLTPCTNTRPSSHTWPLHTDASPYTRPLPTPEPLHTRGFYHIDFSLLTHQSSCTYQVLHTQTRGLYPRPSPDFRTSSNTKVSLYMSGPVFTPRPLCTRGPHRNQTRCFHKGFLHTAGPSPPHTRCRSQASLPPLPCLSSFQWPGIAVLFSLTANCTSFAHQA